MLIVDDDPEIGKFAEVVLGAEGFEAAHVPTADAFLAALAEDVPDICLLDLYLPDATGHELLKILTERYPDLPAVMMTASESVADAVAAMKHGARDYLTKPVQPERLSITLQNVLRLDRRQRELTRLREAVEETFAPEQIVGSTPEMESLRALITKTAPLNVTVLITGESGVGKELVARALHYAGPRRKQPFVDVNSAALTESLLESELFGHEKGAFTGAASRRRGKFERANGGTIFLDEIGDMPLSTQAKILRVLQERAFDRVGGDEKIAVDVRLICATNQDLEGLAEEGKFRRDLLFRINTLRIDVPPLRERASDIPELARLFLARAARRHDVPDPGLSGEAVRSLRSHSWPGNVRELENVMERAVVMCDGEAIRPDHFPAAVSRTAEGGRKEEVGGGLVERVESLERSLILEALEKNGWVKNRAARALGITKRMISYKMLNLGIRRPGQ